MNQKNIKIFFVAVAVVFVVGTGYFTLFIDTLVSTQYSESETITTLQNNWGVIQDLVPVRPGHPGTLVWGKPVAVQFIGKNNILAVFEDGYNPCISVINFEKGEFKILETFKNQGDFAQSDWQNLVKKYGDTSYSVATYSIGVIRNKEYVGFEKLTKVTENVLVKNY